MKSEREGRQPQASKLETEKTEKSSDKKFLRLASKQLQKRSPAAEPAPVSVTPEPTEPSSAKAFPVVGIGALAGGLEAFTAFLKALPPDTGMAFVLVQHMDPTHESMLHRLLARDTAMPVDQVSNEMSMEPNHVYVIPPDTEMTIEGGVLKLIGRPESGPHTPIDTFLCALANDQKDKAIGIILSGIGSDGSKGLQAIKEEGGITLAQEEESAKYPGMPQHAMRPGAWIWFSRRTKSLWS